MTAAVLSRESRAIGLIGFAHFLSHFYMLSLPPLFLHVRDDLGVTFVELGVVLTVYNAATAILQTPMGVLVDRIGARRTLVVSLLALIVFGAAILLVDDAAWFWGLGLALGVFVGPAQSASRSLMARMAPEELRTEMFGLFALSGKATAFVGPWLVGVLTAAFASQRVGMSAIIVFLAAGLLLLLFVREPGKAR